MSKSDWNSFCSRAILKAQKKADHILEMPGLGELSGYYLTTFTFKLRLVNKCSKLYKKNQEDLQVVFLLSCFLGHPVHNKNQWEWRMECQLLRVWGSSCFGEKEERIIRVFVKSKKRYSKAED